MGNSDKVRLLNRQSLKWIIRTLVAISVLSIVISFVLLHNQANQNQTPTEKIKELEVKRNIFLLETSGAKDLNFRQACAVESAARHNPNWTVHLQIGIVPYALEPNSLIKTLIKTYDINVTRIDVPSLLRGTPFQNFSTKNSIDRSLHKVEHLSDLMRLLLIWSEGGIYLDLDCIVLRSLEGYDNFTVTESGLVLANSFFGFAKHHPFMFMCLKDFVENYNPYFYISNGPLLVTRNVEKFCKADNFKNIKPNDCNIKILPIEMENEIQAVEMLNFFYFNSDESMKRINHSLAVHLWNIVSRHLSAKVGENSLLERLMKHHCPVIYSEVEKRNLKFV